MREQTRDARKADEYEEREIAALTARLGEQLAADISPSTAARTLGITRIEREASQPTETGAAAHRVIEALAAQTGFYLPQKYFASGQYNRAAIALTIAVALKPDRASLQYDLARAQARAGRKGEALDALERAVKLGIRGADPKSEPDFASLRDLPRFAAIAR